MGKELNDNEKSLAQRLGDVLSEKKLLMGTAESCTGGRIATMITMWPGSSNHYVGSIISYSNDVKKKLLRVSEKALKEEGAVSRSVVEQMVRGAIKTLGCDCAVATSGIAGPDGGTPEKPVGTIWIAAGVKDKIVSHCYHFGNEREDNILRSADTALQMLLELLQEN